MTTIDLYKKELYGRIFDSGTLHSHFVKTDSTTLSELIFLRWNQHHIVDIDFFDHIDFWWWNCIFHNPFGSLAGINILKINNKGPETLRKICSRLIVNTKVNVCDNFPIFLQ